MMIYSENPDYFFRVSSRALAVKPAKVVKLCLNGQNRGQGRFWLFWKELFTLNLTGEHLPIDVKSVKYPFLHSAGWVEPGKNIHSVSLKKVCAGGRLAYNFQ